MLIECPQDHKPKYFWARPIGFDMPYLLEKDGTVTPIRFDGVVGITNGMKEMLEWTDNVYCPECGDEVNFLHDKEPKEV